MAQEAAGALGRRLVRRDKLPRGEECGAGGWRSKFACEAVANLEGLVETLVQAEEEIGARVQTNLWRASLGRSEETEKEDLCRHRLGGKVSVHRWVGERLENGDLGLIKILFGAHIFVVRRN